MAQRKFYENILLPLMIKAQKNKLTLLFLDGAHFVMGGDFLGYVYGKTRRYIKTFSGRKRYNVYGALDFMTKKLTAVANDTYITAPVVCEMLWKIAAQYTEMPVHIVLDNARYQKCAIVTEAAQEIGVTLHYIPAYSPNINSIERLWKHVKSRLRSKSYNQFCDFKEAINSIIEKTGRCDKDLIDRLINLPVQLYDSFVPINENSFAVVDTYHERRNLQVAT